MTKNTLKQRVITAMAPYGIEAHRIEWSSMTAGRLCILIGGEVRTIDAKPDERGRLEFAQKDMDRLLVHAARATQKGVAA